jgi:hypothetical protein
VIKDTTIDDAFLNIQKRQCGGVYASAADLKALTDALALLRRLAGCEVAKRLICHGRASKVFTTWGKGGWLRGR